MLIRINIPIAEIHRDFPEANRKIIAWLKNSRKTITITLPDGRIVRGSKAD